MEFYIFVEPLWKLILFPSPLFCWWNFFFFLIVFKDNVQLLCLTLHQGSHTRMCQTGIVILYVFVKTFLLCSVETKSMWRTEKLSQSKLFTTERRTCSITSCLQRATTTLRSHLSILQSAWLGKIHWIPNFSGKFYFLFAFF